ncbi:chemotaxis-specific protein-glutamate methyltransferase CheB [Limnoglobus roseus]|uniref:Protein-glutamate methylesterase/protein-glutamine glutaminase n=1 Tax=Limnoglobus roseus TaxID=2598579 RepID=A0A5C1ABJ5_9BACT|nr:chemotaxis-specific protein-glutamate methyltransferase CheB [Limnoglobus roseus]QEL16621.1 chemotaxis-specific protein-glutamate methyltransferase CheB [Limnoglobus roseus]
MNKIRVMIVEDSRVVRELLRDLIGRDPRLEVVAAVESAEEALRVLADAAPDIISMDIRLPGMNGFEATRRIMSTRPTPIVVVSASVEADDLKISMNALRAGALAVVEKPVGLAHQQYEVLSRRLCEQLVNMSQVRVIRQRFNRGVEHTTPALARPPQPSTPGQVFRVLGVVASTGGPAALTQLVGGLPRGFPLPVVVVQHITPCFLVGFADWLGDVTGWPVRIASDGEVASPGVAYLPPADCHLRVAGNRLEVAHDPPVCHQRPSGTVLFRSLARSAGRAGLGVLLTGMGEDGADGLRELRSAGGYTIAEDESTSVVYGMPAAAVRLGGACESLPLPGIAPRVLELVAGKGEA